MVIMSKPIVNAVAFHADRAHKSIQLVRGYVAAGLLAGLPNSEFTPFIDAGTVSRIRAAVGKSKSTKSPVATASAELIEALATVTKRTPAFDKIAAEFGAWFAGVESERVKGGTKPATKDVAESEPTKGTGNAALPEDVDIRALVFDTIVNAKTDADADKFIAALADWATEARVERTRAAKGKTVRKSA